MMRVRLCCLILIFSISTSGCSFIVGYFTYLPYHSGSVGGRYWSKRGVDDNEKRRFYRKCYSKLVEIYEKSRRNKIMSDSDSKLIVGFEIEGQVCMLEHGFTFKDAPYGSEKLCSRSYVKDSGIKSHMIFPACQAKHGKYRK